MIASTNLVIDLGMVLQMLMGWRFVLAVLMCGGLIVCVVWFKFSIHRP